MCFGLPPWFLGLSLFIFQLAYFPVFPSFSSLNVIAYPYSSSTISLTILLISMAEKAVLRVILVSP